MVRKIGNILVVVFSILLFSILLFGDYYVLFSPSALEQSMWTGYPLLLTLSFIFALLNLLMSGKIWAILSGVFALIAGVWGVWGDTFANGSIYDLLTTGNIDGWKQWSFVIGLPSLIAGGIMVIITAKKD